MGSLAVWRQCHLPRVRNILRRSRRQEGHHVLHQPDLVECTQRPRDGCLPAIIDPAPYHHRIQPRSEDHRSMRWVAEDQEQGRRGECRAIPGKRLPRSRRLRNRPRNEPSSFRGTASSREPTTAVINPHCYPVDITKLHLSPRSLHRAIAYSGVLSQHFESIRRDSEFLLDLIFISCFLFSTLLFPSFFSLFSCPFAKRPFVLWIPR